MLLSSYILVEAARMGAGRTVLARMAFNIALEGVLGLLPFLGDAFDAAWKANQRNVRLLDAWLEAPAPVERASRGWLLALLLGVAVLVLGGFFLVFAAIGLLLGL